MTARPPQTAQLTIVPMPPDFQQITALRVNDTVLDVKRRGTPQTIRLAPPGELDRVTIGVSIDGGFEDTVHARFRPGQQYAIRENSCTWIAMWAGEPRVQAVAMPGRMRFRTAPSVKQTAWFQVSSPADRRPVAPGETTAPAELSGHEDGVMCLGSPLMVRVYRSASGDDIEAQGHFAFLHDESVTVVYDGSKSPRFTLDAQGD